MKAGCAGSGSVGSEACRFLMVAHGGDDLLWERDLCPCTAVAVEDGPRRLYRAFMRRGVLLPLDGLPPADLPVVVLPWFLQSGVIVKENLPRALTQAYASAGAVPAFDIRPVLGGDPFLVLQVADAVLERMRPGDALLLMAHGRRFSSELPPEPQVVLDRLLDAAAVRFGRRHEGAVACFDGAPDAAYVVPGLKARRIVVLPYLMADGMHARESMPGEPLAAALGREFEVLPPAGVLLRRRLEGDVFSLPEVWRA